MAPRERVICASRELLDSGRGVRFEVEQRGKTVPAFVVRYRGKLYAYVNRCAHVGIELDWMEGEFFDLSGLYLICATHGAIYVPDSGQCVGGPCKGQRLESLSVLERNGIVFLMESVR